MSVLTVQYDKWFYANLSTKAAIKRAFQALRQTKVKVVEMQQVALRNPLQIEAQVSKTIC